MTTDVIDPPADQVAAPAPAAAAPAPAPTEPVAVDPAPAPTEPKPTDEVVYEFKVPEGFEIGPDGDALKAFAKDLKLPAEAAQRIVDIAVAREQAKIDAHVAQVKAWGAELAADKELGGVNEKETRALAAKALALAPPGLREMLDASGLGNFPPLVKWARAIGKALSEDTHVPADTPVPSTEGMANRLYGGTAPRRN